MLVVVFTLLFQKSTFFDATQTRPIQIDELPPLVFEDPTTLLSLGKAKPNDFIKVESNFRPNIDP